MKVDSIDKELTRPLSSKFNFL